MMLPMGPGSSDGAPGETSSGGWSLKPVQPPLDFVQASERAIHNRHHRRWDHTTTASAASHGFRCPAADNDNRNAATPGWQNAVRWQTDILVWVASEYPCRRSDTCCAVTV